VVARVRQRQEFALVAALWRADRPMAAGWRALLAVRGLLPAGFAIATGLLVTAIERHSGLAAPLITVAVVFIGMQVLGPLHTALSGNLGDRTAAWPTRRCWSHSTSQQRHSTRKPSTSSSSATLPPRTRPGRTAA